LTSIFTLAKLWLHMAKLAKFIKQLRKDHNLTQEFLALELAISRPTFVQIEQGERDLTITEAEKLANIFGISFENFWQDTPQNTKLFWRKNLKKCLLQK